MRTEFVTFDIAKELKAIGCDVPCLAWYNNETGAFNMLGQGDDMDPDYIHTTFFTPEITQAPLWQQVIDWFESEGFGKKYGYLLRICINHRHNGGMITYEINKWNFDNTLGQWERIGCHQSWQYRSDMIKEAINKAIKIVNKIDG